MPQSLAEPTPHAAPPVGVAALEPQRTPHLPTVSVVERTMGEARRSVTWALGGAAAIVGLLAADLAGFSAARHGADQRLERAQRLAGEVRLVGERATSAAALAVATGERRWVDRYDAEIPRLRDAMGAALTLAPPPAAQRFAARAHFAAQQLQNMQEAAFEALAVGERDVARRIFESAPYRTHERALAEATEELIGGTVAAARSDLVALQAHAYLVGAALLLLALLLGTVLWRRLEGRLAQSRDYFLDAEDRMQRLASSDLLTGLANRAALHDAMATAMSRVRRSGTGLAALMIDLDRFKPVNDRHGHMAGDLVLKEVAHRLRRCLRGGELLARYGGDEFVVVIEERLGATDAQAVAERIVEAVSAPICVDALQLQIGASIGIARFPVDAVDGDQLLRKADSALYRAKARGRGAACFYDDTLDELMAERTALEQAMREAIAAGEFVPFYQPIVDLATREVRSLELLCRWRHPQRGLISPNHFIPLAEESGLIGPMMLSVLAKACVDLRDVPTHWRLSINVAPQQIQDSRLVEQVLQVLAEHGIPPVRLDIELTETALVSDTERAREVMRMLKEAGITVTLDDFGTGYSSLCYLAELSFDRIKIDRSFVRTLHERPESAKIVDAVIGLSGSLGVQTVAEGVETERDAEVLLAMGCALAQGFLFGRPVPLAQLQVLQGPAPREPTVRSAAGVDHALGQPHAAIHQA